MLYTRNGIAATSVSWDAPTSRTDGTLYDASQHAGYELGMSDPAAAVGEFQPWVSVPAAYDVTDWPLNELNITAPGTYELALRTVDRGGLVSPWSNAIVITAEYAPPNAPTGFNAF